MPWWPELDSLRADPRFVALIRKMKLPVGVYRRPWIDTLPEIRRFRPRPTDAQIDQFLACADPGIRPMLGLIRETGCRLNEAVTMKHSQIIRDQGLVVFTDHTKSGKFRVVPLTKDCRTQVYQMPLLPGCPFVFCSERPNKPWKNCRKLINEAIDESDFEWFRPKDLRRHYGITLSENGAEMHVILSMVGHSSVKSTENYCADFSPRFAARRALQVLEGRRASAGEPGTQGGTQVGRGRLEAESVKDLKIAAS